MSNHTPEPWLSSPHGVPDHVTQIGIYAEKGNGRDLAVVTSSKADAERIVACVNACAGIPNEVLEAQQSGGLPWSVADQIDQRVQHNRAAAELLAALEEMVKWYGRRGEGDAFLPVDEQEREVRTAMRAIAKHKQHDIPITTSITHE